MKINMAKVSTNSKKIKELLSRNVEQMMVAKHLQSRLLSGDRLRVKLGIDPTGPQLHLGRAVPLWKLRDFQELGHQVVLIIGDFTALVGDPSDKLAKRPMLTPEQIKTNLKQYQKQLGLILDLDKVEWRYNSEWLSAMTFIEVAKLAESFTVQQMLARRNFKDRYSKGVEISLREFLYPLMQGYDSAAVRSDVEIGGTDQLFNLEAGRIIQAIYKQPSQDIMMFGMMEGTDGRKMSTTWGNVINLLDSPSDIFGKVMSLRDNLIIKYFYLATRESAANIKAIEKDLQHGGNPRNSKVKLARAVVSLYHGSAAAAKAASEFDLVHQQKQPPSRLPQFKLISTKPVAAANLLLQAGLAASKGDARRLISQGGVKVDGNKLIDPRGLITPRRGSVIQVGNRRFVKLM
ncbi:TPA: tyrosine--tRNA ligase [Patescibacteria group bacterium]|nr:tyrosine--tRNA ligase [Patescibacteria group bacterium]HCU47861.1 tyrosine--tRNA ligase [Patescibacteria group bacterium]